MERAGSEGGRGGTGEAVNRMLATLAGTTARAPSNSSLVECHIECLEPGELMGLGSWSPGRITKSGVQEASGSICAESPLGPSLAIDPDHLLVESLAEP